MIMAGLTARQRDFLEAFKAFENTNGYSPSYVEMANALGIASKSSVSRIVDELEERGYLCRIPKRARCIRLAVQL
jgi:SOS-response transcriptional repressor LexA